MQRSALMIVLSFAALRLHFGSSQYRQKQVPMKGRFRRIAPRVTSADSYAIMLVLYLLAGLIAGKTTFYYYAIEQGLIDAQLLFAGDEVHHTRSKMRLPSMPSFS